MQAWRHLLARLAQLFLDRRMLRRDYFGICCLKTCIANVCQCVFILYIICYIYMFLFNVFWAAMTLKRFVQLCVCDIMCAYVFVFTLCVIMCILYIYVFVYIYILYQDHWLSDCNECKCGTTSHRKGVVKVAMFVQNLWVLRRGLEKVQKVLEAALATTTNLARLTDWLTT